MPNNIVVAFLAFILARILLYEYIDEVRAVRYCQYRLWKGENNKLSRSFFEKELRVIQKSFFKEKHRDRIKWLAARWKVLSQDEKSAFMQVCRQKLES